MQCIIALQTGLTQVGQVQVLSQSLNATFPHLKSQRVGEGVLSKKSQGAVAACAWLKALTWKRS